MVWSLKWYENWSLHLIGIKGLREIKSNKVQNAAPDFVEIRPNVAEYDLSTFAANLDSGKILNLEIIHLIPFEIGIQKTKGFQAWL